MSGYGLLFAFIASVCWGFSPILQKKALKNMGLLELNAARGIGILLVLLAFLPALSFFNLSFLGLPSFDMSSFNLEELRIDFNLCLLLAFVALVNNMVGDLLLFIAIRDIGVSLASPISSAYPLLVTLISWVWFDEKLTSVILLGTFAVVAGLVLLNLRANPKESKASPRGIAAAIFAAVCWAIGLSLNKYLLLHGVTSFAVTFWRGFFFGLMSIACWIGFLLYRPARLKGEMERLKKIPISDWICGSSAGVIALVIGGWVFTSSLALIPISVATPIASSSPLIAALAATTFMRERLRPLQWVGIVFVVFGAVVVSL